MKSSAEKQRAQDAARHAEVALAAVATRDAAWLALYSLEIDPACGSAWALLARIILELNQDPLGTLAMRYALELGVPEEEKERLARYHRMDLWTRGFLKHGASDYLLFASSFDTPQNFVEMPRFHRWLEQELQNWGSLARAAEAVRRMVGAFSEALEVPSEPEQPLLTQEDWNKAPAFVAFIASDPLKERPALPASASEDPFDPHLQLLSDFWIEQEILSRGAAGMLEAAHEQAQLWARLRPKRVRPMIALLRTHHALGEWHLRDQVIKSLLADDPRDLNELEDARLALGELGLWSHQVEVLSRMDAIEPGHPVILANRGAAFIELGETSRGTSDLLKALQMDPNNGPALATLGLVRMREGRYSAAQELLERAVQIAPEQSQVRVYLAACLNNQGDREAALRELRHAVRLDASNHQAQQLLEELNG